MNFSRPRRMNECGENELKEWMAQINCLNWKILRRAELRGGARNKGQRVV